jgi:hypothetical protein
VIDLHNENYKSLKKNISVKTSEDARTLPYSWISRINTVNITISPKMFYTFNAIPIKIPITLFDRTIMSPFCESDKMAALPLNKFPCSKTAPPLPETTAHVLTSLPSPFYKSHCLPRLRDAPSFPQPAWQFGPAIKLCSMDVSFLMSFL